MIRASRNLALTALVASGALHVAGAIWLAPPPDPVREEGGTPVTVARLGNSFQDVAQGSLTPTPPDELQEPEAPQELTEQVPPEDPTPPEPVTETAQRTAPDQTQRPETPQTTQAPDRVTDTAPRPVIPRTTRAPAPETLPEPPKETQADTPPAPTASLDPPPQDLLEPTPSMLAPVTAAPALTPKALPVAPAQTARLEATQPTPATPLRPEPLSAPPRPEVTQMAALPDQDETSPILSRRPQVRPKEIEARAPAPPKPSPKKTKKTKAKTAKKGTNQPNQTRGSADGKADAKQAQSTKKASGNTKKAGNAAASNYPGLVNRKINRTRRPRVKGRGSVRVRFRVASSGALAGASIAQSSGNPALDQAALSMIRRAAPFPPPPAGAQRSFTKTIKLR